MSRYFSDQDPVARAAHLIAVNGGAIATRGTPGNEGWAALVRVSRFALFQIGDRSGLDKKLPAGRETLVWVTEKVNHEWAARGRELKARGHRDPAFGHYFVVTKSVDCDTAGHAERIDRLTDEFHGAIKKQYAAHADLLAKILGS